MSFTPTTPTPTLATRCSACNTAFRVVQDQLKVSEGWVRCGRCGEVFNALDRIFDLEQARRQAQALEEPGEDAGLPELATTASRAPAGPPELAAAAPEPELVTAEAPPPPEPSTPPAPAPWPDLSNLPVDDNTDLRLIDPEFAKAQQDAQAAGYASALIETEGSGPEPLPPWTLPPAPAKKGRRSGSRRSAQASPPPPAPPTPPSTLDFVLPDLDSKDDDAETDISLDALQGPAGLLHSGPAAAPAPEAPAPTSPPGRDTPASSQKGEDDLPVLEDGISRFPHWVFPDESEVTGDSSLSQLMGPSDEGASLGTDDGQDTPEFVRDAERQARWRSPRMRWVMGAAAAGLSALLLLQVGVIWRDSLAADHPALRGWLDSACATLGCQVAAPRRIEEIVVESSGLSKAGGGRGDEVYKLSFVLRNRSGVSLRLPAIELTLTDAHGGIVSRRVLAGADLHARIDVPMEPGGEVPLYALLSTPGQTVAGYTIEVFYP